MKIAFISDIHANLPAFQAVLQDIDSQQPDVIFCLGDLVGYNVWPNEVVSEIRHRNIACVIGNHEEALMKPDAFSKNLTYKLLTKENINYLIGLPQQLCYTFYNNNLLLVHGSVKATNDYLTDDYPEEEVKQMLMGHDASILLCGHTHKPYHRIVEIEKGKTYRHIINVGSVGKPKDGDVRACYVTLSIDPSFSPQNPRGLKVDFRRIVYDVEMAANAILASAFPDSLAEALQKGE